MRKIRPVIAVRRGLRPVPVTDGPILMRPAREGGAVRLPVERRADARPRMEEAVAILLGRVAALRSPLLLFRVEKLEVGRRVPIVRAVHVEKKLIAVVGAHARLKSRLDRIN